MNQEDQEVPQSEERKIPKFLLLTYLILLIWGIWAFVSYWNGQNGFKDRSSWKKLQQAAYTTYPFQKKSSKD